MNHDTKQTVLVCVTPQQSSRRLVRAGKALAEKYGCTLNVVSVLPVEFGGDPKVPKTLEQLYRFAKRAGGEMAIYFNDDPALTVAAHAAACKPLVLVTGFPGEGSNRFVSTIHLLVPQLPISMVAADDTIYNMLPFETSPVSV